MAVTCENQILLLTVMLFQICHYCRVTKMDFKVWSHEISKGIYCQHHVWPAKKELHSRQKNSKKSRGSWHFWPPPPIFLTLYCYTSYEISFCFKLIIFFQDALEVDLEMFCKAMELPRKWIKFVNKRMSKTI